jgi:hypothetical protein
MITGARVRFMMGIFITALLWLGPVAAQETAVVQVIRPSPRAARPQAPTAEPPSAQEPNADGTSANPDREASARAAAEQAAMQAYMTTNLAGLYVAQGKLLQAEHAYEQWLKNAQKALPPQDPNVIAMVNGLAYLYASEGKFFQAELLYEQWAENAQKAAQRRRQGTGALRPDMPSAPANTEPARRYQAPSPPPAPFLKTFADAKR